MNVNDIAEFVELGTPVLDAVVNFRSSKMRRALGSRIGG